MTQRLHPSPRLFTAFITVTALASCALWTKPAAAETRSCSQAFASASPTAKPSIDQIHASLFGSVAIDQELLRSMAQSPWSAEGQIAKVKFGIALQHILESTTGTEGKQILGVFKEILASLSLLTPQQWTNMTAAAANDLSLALAAAESKGLVERAQIQALIDRRFKNITRDSYGDQASSHSNSQIRLQGIMAEADLIKAAAAQPLSASSPSVAPSLQERVSDRMAPDALDSMLDGGRFSIFGQLNGRKVEIVQYRDGGRKYTEGRINGHSFGISTYRDAGQWLHEGFIYQTAVQALAQFGRKP